MQVPIFFGFAHLYGIKAAQAEADASRARAQGLEQQVIFQVFNSYYGLRTATQRVRTAEDLFAAAQQSEQVAAGRYKEGAGTALDLLTAESALADARAQRINARFAWYIALAQLAHDVGVLGLDGSTPFALQPDTTGTPQ